MIKIKQKITVFNVVLSIFLLAAIAFSIIKVVQSAALNPGHAWNSLDDAPLPIANGGTGAAPGADDQILVSDSTAVATWRSVNDCQGTGNALTYTQGTNAWGCNTTFPRGHLWGLMMSNAADTANDITVAAGQAVSDDGTGVMVLSSAITKQLDASWAVGTAAGGLNTGAEANSTWYEVHLIKRVDTGVVDVMFTTTANRATLPTNYTLKRRIGWIRNSAAGAILQFTQVDDYFTLTTQVNDVAVNKTTTATAVTLTAPPSSIARFRATVDMSTSVNANSVIVFSEIAEGNVTPALATGIASLGYWDLATGVTAGHFELRVNTSSQIEHDADVAVGAFDISTFGWIDHRGKMSDI